MYWEGMRKDIQQFVATCEVYQQNKYQTLSLAGLLQTLPTPTQIWADISMYFVEGFPKAQGKDAIMRSSLRRWSSCMGFPPQLYRIGTRFFLVASGINYSGWLEQNLSSALPITHSQIAKRRSDTILDDLKVNLAKAQNQMKTYTDKNREVISRLKSLAKRRNEKSSPRFYGPYQRAVAPLVILQPLPIMLAEDLELQVEPATVVAGQNSPSGVAEVLIQWQNLPTFEATWETADVIKEQFPNFHLEDKYTATLMQIMGILFLLAEVLLLQSLDDIYYTDPSGTFWQCNAKAIGSGSEGADSSLQEQYNKDLTLQEAETIALSILKQVMEEKVTPNNVDIAKHSSMRKLFWWIMLTCSATLAVKLYTIRDSGVIFASFSLVETKTTGFNVWEN
ncbi:Proteasome subunit alpha type-5, partial [Mucuna pruriens]